MGGGDPACPAAPDLLLGDLRRRRLDAPAHPRHRGAPQEGDRHRSGRPPHLRRRDPGRDRRHRARLLGRRHPPHRGAARRSAGRHGRQVHRPSRRLRQCRRAGGRPEEDRRLPDQRRGLSREASRFGRRQGRPREPQAQGRCRRRPLHHPVLLRGRRLPALPRSRGGGRRPCAGRAGHHAGVELPGGDADCRPVRLQGAAVARRPVRGARRRPRDAPHDRRHRGRRPLPPPAGRRRRSVPLLYAEPRRPHLRDLPSAGRSSGPHGSCRHDARRKGPAAARHRRRAHPGEGRALRLDDPELSPRRGRLPRRPDLQPRPEGQQRPPEPDAARGRGRDLQRLSRRRRRHRGHQHLQLQRHQPVATTASPAWRARSTSPRPS